MMSSYGTITGTGDSAPFTAAPNATIFTDGDFGASGTVTLELRTQDGRWVPMVSDGNNHVLSAGVTRSIGNTRTMDMRLAAVGVTSVYYEFR